MRTPSILYITSNLPFTSSFPSLRAAASPNRFETKPWLRTAARSSADSLAALARYRKYISLLNISLACYSIGTKANQTHCASGVCQGRRNTGNDASAPELPAQGSDGAHGPVYEGPDTHVTAQDQPAGHGTRSTQEGKYFPHARIWHRLWGISKPFPIPSVKRSRPCPCSVGLSVCLSVLSCLSDTACLFLPVCSFVCAIPLEVLLLMPPAATAGETSGGTTPG